MRRRWTPEVSRPRIGGVRNSSLAAHALGADHRLLSGDVRGLGQRHHPGAVSHRDGAGPGEFGGRRGQSHGDDGDGLGGDLLRGGAGVGPVWPAAVSGGRAAFAGFQHVGCGAGWQLCRHCGGGHGGRRLCRRLYRGDDGRGLGPGGGPPAWAGHGLGDGRAVARAAGGGAAGGFYGRFYWLARGEPRHCRYSAAGDAGAVADHGPGG